MRQLLAILLVACTATSHASTPVFYPWDGFSGGGSASESPAPTGDSQAQLSAPAAPLKDELCVDDEIRKKYKEYLIARLDREIEKASEHREAIQFSSIASYAIFVCAHVFLFLGLIAASVEYGASIHVQL